MTAMKKMIITIGETLLLLILLAGFALIVFYILSDSWNCQCDPDYNSPSL